MNKRIYKDAREGIYCNLKTKAECSPLTCDLDPEFIEDLSPDYKYWTEEFIKSLNHSNKPGESINLPGKKYWNNQEYKSLLRNVKTEIRSEEVSHINAWQSSGDGFSMELYNSEGILCRIDFPEEIMDALAINWLKLREII